MTFEELKDLETENIMQTYARFQVGIESGAGSYLKDFSGKEYLDFTSGIGVNALGYGDCDIAKAVSDQVLKLVHISNLFYTEPCTLLAEKLIKISKMSKVFFSNSGAEANEGAIKLARKYSFDKYGKGRANIVTLKNSFHGRTITTLKATGQDSFHDFFYPFTEGFVYGIANDAENTIALMDNTVCAIMMESIQGEGGVLPLQKDFVKKVVEYANTNDILIIFDEVQTGLGRTGKYFGYQHFEISPDIITLAKGLGGGLPIGAFICNDKLKNVLSFGNHGSTFGGNPVCCAAANVVLDKITTDTFLDSVVEKSKYAKQLLRNLKSDKIKEIRGEGLMIGIEIESLLPREVAIKCIEKGLLVLTAGKNAIRLLPPLTITKEELKKGIDIIEEVMTIALEKKY